MLVLSNIQLERQEGDFNFESAEHALSANQILFTVLYVRLDLTIWDQSFTDLL